MFGAMLLAAVEVSAVAPAVAEPVTLHIEAVGEVAPDLAMVSSAASKFAPSQAELMAALAAERAGVMARLKAAGVAEADMTVSLHIDPPAPPMVTVAPPIPAPGAAGLAPVPVPPSMSVPNYFGSIQYVVTVRNVQKLSAVYDIFGIGPMMRGPQNTNYRVSDPVAAHRLAVARALEKAQGEAELYAAALHRKLGPIVRVSNAKPQSNALDLFQMFGKADGAAAFGRGVLGAEVAAVAVDYSLTP